MGEPAGHLVLVGLMGSGKSTVGRRLAARLDRPFVDADEAVADRAGMPVPELFARRGEAAFRALEAATLADVLDDPRPLVVATGGGAVLDAGTRSRLAAVDTVWLRAAPATLARRVGAGGGRPLLAGGDVVAELERLAEARAARYGEVARTVVDVDDLGIDEVVARIAAAVGADGDAATRSSEARS